MGAFETDTGVGLNLFHLLVLQLLLSALKLNKGFLLILVRLLAVGDPFNEIVSFESANQFGDFEIFKRLFGLFSHAQHFFVALANFAPLLVGSVGSVGSASHALDNELLTVILSHLAKVSL